MHIVLSPYALSRDTTLRITANGEQPCQFITLSNLRLLPVPSILRTLRSTSGEVLRVVVQEPSERAVLPLMLSLASLSKADRIEVHDLSTDSIAPVGSVRAALGTVGTLAATLAGRHAVTRLRRRATELLGLAPVEYERINSNKALYLKTNLMLGAKAGGSIGHVAGVANELLRRNPRSVIVAPEVPPLIRADARIQLIPPLRQYGVPPEVNHFRFNEPAIRVASALLGHEDFGFIYQRLTLGNLAGVELSLRHRIPLVLEYNGSEVWVSQNWGHKLKYVSLAQSVEDACLRHAHRIVTVSEVLADELVARGVQPERVVWYPNCIDPELFDPQRHDEARRALRRKLGIADSDLVVMFIGTFGLWHGAETLAEAARMCLAQAPNPAAPRLRFAFVGDGARFEAVRTMLRSEIERQDVFMTGLVPQHEAPGYLAMADIFCSPHVPPRDGSRFFGSPTKLFEYMAMARPIVASNLDQIGQVLHPAITGDHLCHDSQPSGEETAVLVEPGSAASIVEALEYLRRRPEVRSAMSQAARRVALSQYTWERHVDKILSALP